MVAGLLFMLIFGMIEFGFAFFEMQTLRGAAPRGRSRRRGRRRPTATSSPDRGRLAGALPSGYSGWIASRAPLRHGGDDNEAVTVKITRPRPSGNVQQAFQIDVPFLPPITSIRRSRGPSDARSEGHAGLPPACATSAEPPPSSSRSCLSCCSRMIVLVDRRGRPPARSAGMVNASDAAALAAAKSCADSRRHGDSPRARPTCSRRTTWPG